MEHNDCMAVYTDMDNTDVVEVEDSTASVDIVGNCLVDIVSSRLAMDYIVGNMYLKLKIIKIGFVKNGWVTFKCQN